MTQSESFSNSLYTDQMHLAERELSAFIAAVAELFGADQARMSVDDWLDESGFMDVSPRSTHRDWRSITIAASVRLANRLNVALHRQSSLGTLQLVPRYRQYHRPIVSIQRLCLDALLPVPPRLNPRRAKQD